MNELEIYKFQCCPYIDDLCALRLRNAPPDTSIDESFLNATVVNCIAAEINQVIMGKLMAKKRSLLKLDLSDAQAVVLFKFLKHLPGSAYNIGLQMLKANWFEQLEQHLISAKLYQHRTDRQDTGV